MDADFVENPRAVPGDNNPPEPTPFELSKTEISDLFMKAKYWLDGAPVETQEQADAIGKLKKDTAAAIARAEERRKVEAKPFDDGKAEVQSRYNTLIGDTKSVKGIAVLTVETCNLALVPFLAKQQVAIDEKARVAREEANERLRIAQDAMRASRDDLAARERAEALASEAKAAEKVAARTEKERPAVRGGGRAITMRTKPVAILVDAQIALRHAREFWADDLKEWLRHRAQQDLDGGRPSVPGFDVEQVRSVA